MNVAIIKYNAGNIYSVYCALERLGVAAVITADKEQIARADKVIFPGQGEATQTMQYLRNYRLDELIVGLKQPVLGICIGMQLLCRHSEEGDVNCLGVFDTDVKKFHPQKQENKIPHMGWNHFTEVLDNTLFKGLVQEDHVYFVHSYYVPVNRNTTAVTDYIHPFSAGLQKDNFYATQFHPEKSGKVGATILKNFLDL